MGKSMKDSGVEWIGQIPDTWNLNRTKNNYHFHKDIVGTNSDKYERLALTLNGVIKRSKVDSTGLQPENFDGYQLVRKNDLVFKLIDLENVSTSRVGLSPYEGIVSPAYLIITPEKNTNQRFGEYYFLSMWQMEVFNHIGDDGVRSSLNKDDLLNIPYVSFSSEEQKRIADFLDTKCAAIDNVISKTQESIEEYKKLKQSIITEAVTKGVRGDRPMKDSGIEWIGEMPKEWSRYKLLHALSMPITDGPHTTPDLFDIGIPFVSAEAVSSGNGTIDFTHIRGYISEEFYNECCKKYIPQRDDIYMIKSGATTGKVAIVDTDTVFNIWSPLAAIRADTNKMLPRFLYYYLQSDGFQKQVELSWTFGTQQNVGMRTLEQLKVLVPSIGEQKEISDFLDDMLLKINNLISSKEKQIEELKTYKKSLIYEYVTGKKEVPSNAN